MEKAQMVASVDKLNENQVILAVYSLRDFERALSALVFLGDEKLEYDTNRAHLRRHYCFETTAIICYTRPFSSAHGKIEPLSLTEFGVDLTVEETELHDRLKTLRDKAFAHSDFNNMEFRLDPILIDAWEKPIHLPHLTVPEGPGHLSSNDIEAMDLLIQKIMHGIIKRVSVYVQESTEPLIVSGGEIHRSE